MATADSPTTITIRQSTRRLLESVKATGQTYDDLLLELVDENYSPELVSELKRRFSSPTKALSASDVYRRWGI
jgi:hypothetical protein